jgi:hypothetical protein
MTPTNSPTRGEYGQLPELVGIERDSYLFVALLEDQQPSTPSNWLLQTFRVDPSDGDDDELVARVTERYDGGNEGTEAQFEDQYTIAVSTAETAGPPGVDSMRRALERWYVACEACGRHYAARILGDEIVLLTPDGRSDCMNEVCVEGTSPVRLREETTLPSRACRSSEPTDSVERRGVK